MTFTLNKDLVRKMFSKEYIAKTILSLILVISLFISLIFFLISGNTRRKMYLFPTADNDQLIVEYRNLARKPVQGELQLYIDEMLLGSKIERTRYLFTPGTKVLSCFQREDVLFLDLSADILKVNEGVIDIKDGIDLLERNIKENFPKIKTVTVFVDGKLAFEK